jgi:hypothetical protein
MLPKTGKKLHGRSRASGTGDGPFEQAIAIALRSELGLTHQAVKTVMVWTGASERTVKALVRGNARSERATPHRPRTAFGRGLKLLSLGVGSSIPHTWH